MPARFEHLCHRRLERGERAEERARQHLDLPPRAGWRDGSPNPATRYRAKRALADLLATPTARGERAVLGFDFPFGYPAGFAHRLGLAGVPWRALWDEIAAQLSRMAKTIATTASRSARASISAFPASTFRSGDVRSGATYEHLGPRHHGGHEAGELAEKRLIDRWMVGAQPCWKLAYTGSVGSQVLTGIPVVRALRDDPRWADRARIWPFETGLSLPDEARFVFAEVWPSWWKWQSTREPGEVNDRAQVRHVARLFEEADQAGALTGWFAGGPNLTPEERRVVEAEEAWTLGVTARKRSPKTASPRPVSAGRSSGSLVPGPGAGIHKRPARGAHLARDEANPGRERDSGNIADGLEYLREPAAIYRRSFALIRDEAELGRFPAALRPLAVRLAHAAGDVGDPRRSRLVARRGCRRQAGPRRRCRHHRRRRDDGGRDHPRAAAGRQRGDLHVARPHPAGARHPAQDTRSAAAVELWRPRLAGAVVAIGNAPTALFHLLELLVGGRRAAGPGPRLPGRLCRRRRGEGGADRLWPWPAFIALRGRRGGSALAAAAVNALAGKPGA